MPELSDDTKASEPRPPTRRDRIADAATARLLKLPIGRADFTVVADVPVRMRDGIALLTDIYRPTGPSSGTVLVRTPYGRSGMVSRMTARCYAAHGYTVVNQSCRGTSGSGGYFEPFSREIDDGADTVAWLRGQAWFGGRLALCGASYLGYTAWAIMTDPPPELACAVVEVSAYDNYDIVHGGGAFALEPTLTLCEGFDHLDVGTLRGLPLFVTARHRLRPGLEELPMLRAEETVLAGSRMPYRAWLSAQRPDDPVWRPQRLQAALERVDVPILLHEGWQDRFVEQALAAYATLRRRGVDVALTIGPWSHVEVATKGAGPLMSETLDWLAEHLSGTGQRRRRAPVRYVVTGPDEWREGPEWPPSTRDTVLYLQPDGALGPGAPPAGAGCSAFTYDPADPTPSVGGRVVNPAAGGRRDNRNLERRSDVLVFTTAALNEPLEVIGSPTVELAHRTDNPYADLFVRLCEVGPNGRSTNLSDGFQRLSPTTSGKTVELKLDTLAHRFPSGSRVRLIISGGAHPRWARNLGTGEDPATGTALAPSRQTIGHGSGGLSRVLLPTPIC
jgi:putative CocE/NonD family hydrolase